MRQLQNKRLNSKQRIKTGTKAQKLQFTDNSSQITAHS